MNKKHMTDSIALFAGICSFLLTCSPPSQSPEKPRLAPMSDNSVFATDTIRLIANPVFAPAKIRCYVWSSDGGNSFPESTDVNYVTKCWKAADSGIHLIAVKILDTRGIASDSITCTIFVLICRPNLSILADTLIDFGNTVEFRAVNTSNCRRILSYVWSFDNGMSFPDTTRDSSIKKQWGINDTGKTVRVLCQAIVTPGLLSQGASIAIHIGYCRPTIHINGIAAIHTGDTTRFFISTTVQCPAAYYLWSFNNGLSFTDTTYNSSFLKRWEPKDTSITMVVAAAKTEKGIFSFPDTLRVFATPCIPTTRISGDSVAYVGDSTRFAISAISSCSPIAWYIWSFREGDSYSDTLRANSIAHYWNPADTGTRTIFAKVQTVSGEVSLPNSCKIKIRSANPQVTLPADTSIVAGDTMMVIARIDSAHRPIVYFAWSVDHSSQEILTKVNIFSYSCLPEKAGAHSLSVRAVDGAGFTSAMDSMTITSVLVYPTLKVPRDTLLKRKDTLLATVSAATVGGGAIKQFLWNIGSLAWTDSGASPQKKIWYQGKDTINVSVGARDNRGVTKIDSFHVYFNAPPADLRMTFPRQSDTIIFRNIDSTFKRGVVSFRFSADDKNGAQDTLAYSLFLGKSLASLVKVYEGRDTVWTTASPLDTSDYYWTLTAKDRRGDSVQTSGGFTCLLQQTICFTGHSIIVGFGDSLNGNGGMRGRALSTMRTRRGCAVKVKPIGPLTTGFMTAKQDDSCFAVPSYRAKDLWLLMKNSFPRLNADLWVVMLGVNDAYSYNNEFRQLLWIIDTIHVHNPQACTYVMNGLPNVASYGQDRIFNGWLADSIKTRKTANSSWNIWNINAFKKFTLADSASPNPALFAPETPLLHPNAAGYDTLTKMLLDTMKLKFP